MSSFPEGRQPKITDLVTRRAQLQSRLSGPLFPERPYSHGDSLPGMRQALAHVDAQLGSRSNEFHRARRRQVREVGWLQGLSAAGKDHATARLGAAEELVVHFAQAHEQIPALQVSADTQHTEAGALPDARIDFMASLATKDEEGAAPYEIAGGRIYSGIVDGRLALDSYLRESDIHGLVAPDIKRQAFRQGLILAKASGFAEIGSARGWILQVPEPSAETSDPRRQYLDRLADGAQSQGHWGPIPKFTGYDWDAVHMYNLVRNGSIPQGTTSTILEIARHLGVRPPAASDALMVLYAGGVVSLEDNQVTFLG